MRRRIYALAVLLLFAAASAYFQPRGRDSRSLLVATASAATNACAFPTTPAATPEQTAWQLFVAANCPANGNQVVWENWIEQRKLYPASGTAGGAAQARSVKRLHGSPLAAALAARSRGPALQLVPSEDCLPMNRRPPNVLPNATVCEEVHLNPPSHRFISGHGYTVRPGQTAAAKKGADIEFPTPAVSVKVDWIPASDFSSPFTCTSPPPGLHVETIDGACYAMAGMHISSKLLKDWIWATFEPQSMLTNPLRCTIFGPCNDPWGSNPATSNGGASGFTNQTPALTALMKQAKLAPEFLNYRLDGVQTQFTNSNGTPIFLGNSIIEGENAGMANNTASCITCHSVSSIKNDGTDGITVLANMASAPVGAQYKVPTAWIARDFSWSMSFACPQVVGGLQTCSASTSAVKNEKKD